MVNDKRDVTKELTPTQFLGCYISEALGGGYRMWIPEWSWNSNKARANQIARCLQDFGITNELLEKSERFKEILERGY